MITLQVKWAKEDSEPECISWIPYARCKAKATFLNYDDTTRVFDQNNWLHCEVDGEVDSDPDNEFEEIGLEQRGVAMPDF